MSRDYECISERRLVERFAEKSPKDRENKLYVMAAEGRIDSEYMFRGYVERVKTLPYQNKLNLIRRIRAGIGDAQAEQLEREISPPFGWQMQ